MELEPLGCDSTHSINDSLHSLANGLHPYRKLLLQKQNYGETNGVLCNPNLSFPFAAA